jgi:GNAT superfamily N-acetyltransferase
MLEISKFETKDLHELQLLIHHTIKVCYPAIYAPEVVDFFLNYHSEEEIISRSEKAIILVLKVDGKMLATGFLLENELGGVYVHPDFQGLGYGRMIVNALLKIADDEGLNYIHLDSTSIAKSMYLKLGFKVTEEAVQMVDKVPLPYSKMVMKITGYNIIKEGGG